MKHLRKTLTNELGRKDYPRTCTGFANLRRSCPRALLMCVRSKVWTLIPYPRIIHVMGLTYFNSGPTEIPVLNRGEEAQSLTERK